MQRLLHRNAPVARGFTLVELMVVLIVLAVLVGMAMPSFTQMVNRNRLTAAANEMVASMQIARVEAVRRNMRVALCPSTDGSTCAGADWSRLIVFADANGNGNPGDAGDEVVRFVESEAAGLTVNASGNVATNNRIAFASDGFARVGNAGARVGGISFCSPKLPEAENTRDIAVAVSRISVVHRNGTSACTAMAN